jgi:hypothetical protein
MSNFVVGSLLDDSKKSILRKTDSIGILCRGKSLECLKEVTSRFNSCFLVNDWGTELKIFSKYLLGKKIVHFMNADKNTLLSHKQYEKFRIDHGLLTWTRKHLMPGKGKVNLPKAVAEYQKFVTVSFLPDEYYQACRDIGNSGVLCALIVTELFKPKEVWVVGLDFYSQPYLIKPRTKDQWDDIKKRNLVRKLHNRFIRVVKAHRDVQYHLVTCYSEVKPQENLEVTVCKLSA